jgi:predicted peptidase
VVAVVQHLTISVLWQSLLIHRDHLKTLVESPEKLAHIIWNRIVTSRIQECILQPGNLRYSLALPGKTSEDQIQPLILALHFAGHGTPFYGKLILTELVEPALRNLGAILLAPDCTGPDWTHSQSEKDLLAILNHVFENHNVDRNRILITGYSMGGIGTWYLAARHQDKFSAALIMAGMPPPNIAEVDWKIPLLIIQSCQDEMMPLQPTEIAVKQLKAAGKDVRLLRLEGVTHFETWRYTVPLCAAIPWIQKAWGQEASALPKT